MFLNCLQTKENWTTLRRHLHQRKSSLSMFLVYDRKIIDILVKNRKLINIGRKRRREMVITSIDRLKVNMHNIIVYKEYSLINTSALIGWDLRVDWLTELNLYKRKCKTQPKLCLLSKLMWAIFNKKPAIISFVCITEKRDFSADPMQSQVEID